MACPLNRNKFTGSGYCKETSDVATAAKEMNTRLKEMMAVREAQDGGNFKTTTSWSSSAPSLSGDPGAPGAPGALDPFFTPSPVDPNKELKR